MVTIRNTEMFNVCFLNLAFISTYTVCCNLNKLITCIIYVAQPMQQIFTKYKKYFVF